MIKIYLCKWDYDCSISKIMIKIVHKDGLIVPLIIKDGEIHKRHREKYMAFKTESLKLGVAEPNILAVEWEDLTQEERLDLR